MIIYSHKSIQREQTQIYKYVPTQKVLLKITMQGIRVPTGETPRPSHCAVYSRRRVDCSTLITIKAKSVLSKAKKKSKVEIPQCYL